MSAVTFDTLKYVERLTQAGMPEAHAKAEAEALRPRMISKYYGGKSLRAGRTRSNGLPGCYWPRPD